MQGSERDVGELLIEQGLATREHVEERLSILEQMKGAGVTPLPKLGELLLRKGYLTTEAYDKTLKSERKTQSEDLPEAVREALKEPGNDLGRFVKVRLLGKGGMREVWHAWEKEPGRFVALKFVFEITHEAQIVARLQHPNIAQVHGVERNTPLCRKTPVVSILPNPRMIGYSNAKLVEPNIHGESAAPLQPLEELVPQDASAEVRQALRAKSDPEIFRPTGAHQQTSLLANVQITIPRTSDNLFWNDTGWAAPPTWLPVVGTVSWKYWFSPVASISCKVESRATDTGPRRDFGQGDVPAVCGRAGTVGRRASRCGLLGEHGTHVGRRQPLGTASAAGDGLPQKARSTPVTVTEPVAHALGRQVPGQTRSFTGESGSPPRQTPSFPGKVGSFPCERQAFPSWTPYVSGSRPYVPCENAKLHRTRKCLGDKELRNRTARFPFGFVDFGQPARYFLAFHEGM